MVLAIWAPATMDREDQWLHVEPLVDPIGQRPPLYSYPEPCCISHSAITNDVLMLFGCVSSEV